MKEPRIGKKQAWFFNMDTGEPLHTGTELTTDTPMPGEGRWGVVYSHVVPASTLDRVRELLETEEE